MAVAALFCIGF